MKGAIHLASASPRRKLLLEQMGLRCTVIGVDVDEPMDQTWYALDLAKNLSERKMIACLNQRPELRDDAWILTADTLIVLGDEKIGKAYNREDAARILNLLQGRTHQVITAFSIYSPRSRTYVTEHESTDVTFSSMDSMEIDDYLDTGEWIGVAGAYRIQEQ
jgi:septum formation protein